MSHSIVKSGIIIFASFVLKHTIQYNTNTFIGMKHKTMFLAKNDNTSRVSTNTKYKINRSTCCIEGLYMCNLLDAIFLLLNLKTIMQYFVF